MSYKTGEELIEELIKSVDGFTVANTGRGSKWRLLNSGSSDHYAILRKGAHTEEFFTGKQKQANYRTVIEVVQRVSDDLTDRYDALLDYADSITNKVDSYFRLADTANTIRDANLSGGNEVQEVWIQNVFAWIKIELYVDWTEDTNVTFAE